MLDAIIKDVELYALFTTFPALVSTDYQFIGKN